MKHMDAPTRHCMIMSADINHSVITINRNIFQVIIYYSDSQLNTISLYIKWY